MIGSREPQCHNQQQHHVRRSANDDPLHHGHKRGKVRQNTHEVDELQKAAQTAQGQYHLVCARFATQPDIAACGCQQTPSHRIAILRLEKGSDFRPKPSTCSWICFDICRSDLQQLVQQNKGVEDNKRHKYYSLDLGLRIQAKKDNEQGGHEHVNHQGGFQEPREPPVLNSCTGKGHGKKSSRHCLHDDFPGDECLGQGRDRLNGADESHIIRKRWTAKTAHCHVLKEARDCTTHEVKLPALSLLSSRQQVFSGWTLACEGAGGTPG
eukprot:scaffold68281_cov17-Prasinocladus_malaysianus.AAC.2